MSGRLAGFPHWLRDIDANLPVTAQYVVHGNIRDLFLVPANDPADARPRVLDVVPAIWSVLEARGYAFLLYHSPVHGLQLVPGSDEAAAVEALGTLDVQLRTPVTFAQLAEVVTRIGRVADGGVEPGTGGIVIDYQSQQRPVGEPPSQELHDLMLSALTVVHQTQAVRLYNPLLWLVDRPSDLPSWMVSGSDGIRQVPVPVPDLTARLRAATFFARALPGTPHDLGDLATRFGEATEGMSIRAMSEIGRLARDAGLDGAHIEDAVRAFRLGLVDNPWKQPELRKRIVEGDAYLDGSAAEARDKGVGVLGQPRAVRHATDVLVRSTMALSGAWQGARSGAPRGVMFFAGPTGVGKTELAKAITSLVFGDERAYIRFDMSEFATEHSEARLIGAPPGYVGHGRGGELTDAVRRRPFSVILFDEIEKAHPRILDKFLQILSDGRLTDGTGATVYFTDAIIIFTSNLGTHGVDAGSPDYVAQVRAAVERSFRDDLDRPELLGRIGDNIVVFDYLTADIGRSLVGKYLDNVVARVANEHGIALTIPAEVRARLSALCTADMSLGGRGVGQALDSCFVNPLGRALVLTDAVEAAVTDVRAVDGGYEVDLA